MAAAYRQPDDGDLPRVISWSTLQPESRERLAAACRLERAAPLLWATPKLPSPAHLSASAAALGGLLIALLSQHFGSAYRSSILQEGKGQAVVLCLSAAATLCAALSLDAHRRRGALPFAPGLYLFPSELIEASGSTLRLIPTTALSHVGWQPDRPADPRGAASLRFGDHGLFSLPCSEDEAAGLAAQIERLRDALQRARDEGDHAAAALLDPLWAERPLWRQQPPPQALRHAPARAALALLPALAVLGALGGLGLARAVQDASERAALAAAVQQRDLSALRSLSRLPRAVGDEADLALLTAALESPGWRELHDYRKNEGAQAQRADEAHFERVSSLARRAERLGARGSPDAFREHEEAAQALWSYLRVGGLHEAEADDLLFRLLLRRPEDRAALAGYASERRRHADEARRLASSLSPR